MHLSLKALADNEIRKLFVKLHFTVYMYYSK